MTADNNQDTAAPPDDISDAQRVKPSRAEGSVMDLAEVHRRADKGPVIMLARRGFAVLVGLVTLAILPRLLGPEAYGLAAMSAIVFTLAEMFKDFGLSSALLRKGTIHPDEVNFLFWVNIATTAALTILIAAASPLVGLFFHQPIVTWIVLVSLIGFFASGLAMQHRGLMNRDLRFAELAIIDTVCLLAQFAVSLILALIYRNVWSIVIGGVVGATLNSISYIVLSGWRPSRPRMIDDARTVLKFGANTSVYTLSVFITTNITPILIGRFFGVYHLGQFNQANTLLSIPLRNAVEPLAQATLPVLARLRPYPDHYRSRYLDFVRSLTFVVLPMSVLLMFAGRPVVEAVLGAQWREAGSLLALLAPVAGVVGIGYAVTDLFVTQDRSKDMRVLGLVEMVGRVTAVSIAIFFSIYAAAIAHVVATMCAVLGRVWLISRNGGIISMRDHGKAVMPAVPASLGTAFGCGVAVLAQHWLALHALQESAMICISGLVVTALAIAVTPSSREALRNILSSRNKAHSKDLMPNEVS